MIKKYVSHLIPRFLERPLRRHMEKQQLSHIPAAECETAHLLADKEVNMEKIFNSSEIEKEWNLFVKEIAKFNIPDGTGGANPGEGRAIFYLITYLNPHAILEIGTHIGTSTVHIAAAIRNNKKMLNSKPIKLLSVDIADVNNSSTRPWLKSGTTYSPFEMVDMLRCSDFVTFIRSASLKYMAECRQKYDFIFLDGDHKARTVYQEIPAALRLLEKGGVILLHDYFPNLKPLWSDNSVIPGPFLATERLIAECQQVKVLPLGRLPWPTKCNTNLASLALLVRKTA
ncbi:MAG: class I SAM-dependent methyltransferase [Candidatus Omnitrophica bacterium]|nr:class I SAM-dependent methyltransferase [Candidatus Omnitrophota bacterium]